MCNIVFLPLMRWGVLSCGWKTCVSTHRCIAAPLPISRFPTLLHPSRNHCSGLCVSVGFCLVWLLHSFCILLFMFHIWLKSWRVCFSPSDLSCLPGGSMVKTLPTDTEDSGSISGLGRSPGEGNGNPLQYPCLGNPTDREVWQAAYSTWGCKKSWIWLSD